MFKAGDKVMFTGQFDPGWAIAKGFRLGEVYKVTIDQYSFNDCIHLEGFHASPMARNFEKVPAKKIILRPKAA